MTSYETDFYAWTREQAAALRRGRLTDLDLEHLAEEIEDLGNSQLAAIESALTRVVEHLLKLEYSPAEAPRAGWLDSVDAHRLNARKRLRRNPQLLGRIELAEVYQDAHGLAAKSLRRYDGVDPAVLPPACPYTLEQIQDENWYPAKRAGA